MHRMVLLSAVLIFFLAAGGDVFAQTVYRASTVNLGGTYNIEENSPSFEYIVDVKVMCGPEDERNPLIATQCERTNGLLSSVINPQYLIHGSNPERPFWGDFDWSTEKQVLKIPIVDVNDSSKVYVVNLFCQQRAGRRFRCNNAGYDIHDVAVSRQYIITIEPDSFKDVPNGVYSASFSTTTMSWHSHQVIVNFSFNFTFRINRSGSSVSPTSLYALQGNTLPLFFSRYGEDLEFGKGGLDFCLQTTDYSNVSLTIVSPDPALIRGGMPDQFVLTNTAALEGQPDRFSLMYRVKSLTLGRVDHATTDLPHNCGDPGYAFCRGYSVPIDFSRYPKFSSS